MKQKEIAYADGFLTCEYRLLVSTVRQPFILRVLIEIAKKTYTPLYVGFFDLEKDNFQINDIITIGWANSESDDS